MVQYKAGAYLNEPLLLPISYLLQMCTAVVCQLFINNPYAAILSIFAVYIIHFRAHRSKLFLHQADLFVFLITL